MSGAFEQVFQHNFVESVKNVESLLKACVNQIEISLNFQHPINMSFALKNVEMQLKSFEHSIQHFPNSFPISSQLLLNECWSNVETI